MDMVCDWKELRNHTRMAQRQTDGWKLFRIDEQTVCFSNKKLLHWWLGELQQTHSFRETCHRKVRYMENWKKKPEFQDTYKTSEPENNLFFKERNCAWQCYRNVYQPILFSDWLLFRSTDLTHYLNSITLKPIWVAHRWITFFSINMFKCGTVLFFRCNSNSPLKRYL